MKRKGTYVVLWMALLLNISLFISRGWAVERDVLSFVSEKGKDHPIILMNTQGKILERLRTDPGAPFSFSWSPDKRSIAYDSFQGGSLETYVMDVSENEHRQLTFDGNRNRSPAWSPNGKWIVFISERAGDTDLYRIDVDGKNVRQLTKQGNCRKPAWSPDSQWIAFTSKPSLFVMDADGRKLRELSGRVIFSGCTWSPDGKQIAFISNDAVGGIGIFGVDIDGKNSRQLARPDPLSLIYDPVWSPSGNWIAYISVPLLQPGPVNQLLTKGVISVANIANGGRGEPIEATRGMPKKIAEVGTGERALSIAECGEAGDVLGETQAN